MYAKTSFLSLIFLCLTIPLMAQYDKKVVKAIQLHKAGKTQKAIKTMEKVVVKTPTSKNYDLLVNLHHEAYLDSRRAVNVLAQLLVESAKNEDYSFKITSSDMGAPFFGACRRACLYSQSTAASVLLRNYFVDYSPDTAISDEAYEKYQEGEDAFGKKEFEEALVHYRAAVDLQPNYYKATIYLGDAHWALKNMDSAALYFRKGIVMCPDLLEPRKYLVDALTYALSHKEAQEECIGAFYVYPDTDMFAKYQYLAEENKKRFDHHWIPRGCEVNRMGKDSQPAKGLWAVYQQAKQEIAPYCDENGIVIKPNAPSGAKYMETYCWEKMLKSSASLPSSLQFAKQMMDKGYLDCYVFYSVFHIDLYEQYRHYTDENKDKVKAYFEEVLTEG